MQVQVEQSYNASRERTFDVLTDLRSADQRIPDIRKIDVLTDGPIRVGTRWRETRVMFGKVTTEQMEIVAMERPEMYAVGSESCGSRFRITFRFEDVGNALTRVVCDTRIEAMSFFAKLMSPLGYMMKGVMKRCLEKDMASLKPHVEGTSATHDDAPQSADSAAPAGT